MIYTYVDYRHDDGTPFYVGHGDDARIRNFANRNLVWHAITFEHGCHRKIVLAGDDADAAMGYERFLIMLLKTGFEFGGANQDCFIGVPHWNKCKRVQIWSKGKRNKAAQSAVSQ
jgi:hypothetical protein